MCLNVKTSLFFCIFWMFSGKCLADFYQSSTYFCTDLNPQHIVDIKELEGIWYVMEKIIHTEERHYVINVTTCPVIHISEDRTQTTTYNPLYKTYGTTYGSNFPYNNNPTDPRASFTSEQDYLKRKEEYDRHTTYDYQRRKINNLGYLRDLYSMKYLRVYWDDSSYNTEYHLRYNVSRPGFWISSGPEDGRTPDDRKHFAGTIQVIKAVGNHLVLTFCHPSVGSSEKNQLFTVITSRENRLDSADINSVHGILLRKGLNTHAVEKSCNGAQYVKLSSVLATLVSGFYLIFFVK